MSRKFSSLDVATSLGNNNEFLVDQNGVPYRIGWSTIKSSAQNAGSIAGAAAGIVAASAVAQDAASAAGYAAGSAAAQVVFASLEERVSANTLAITSVQAMIGATSAALRDDITSIRVKHTSVAAIVLTSANLAQTSADIQGVIAATSAALRGEIATVSAQTWTNLAAITSVQAQVSKSDVDIATNIAAITSVQALVATVSAQTWTNLAAITSVQALTATNLAAITSVQAMVSKSAVKQTSVASQSDGIATVMLEVIVASTANTSTYGYRVSAENGIRTDKSGTPGNGQLLFALDFGTLTCVGNVGQDTHMPHWDSLGKEQLCPVSSLAHKFTSIASGVTRDDTGQIITGGALVSVYNIGDVSTGTHTLDYGLRPMQAYKNKGAHTLAPDTQTGYVTLIIKASTGAGAITTSGWSLVDGDAFETSSGGHFICYVQTTEAQSGTNKSHLNVKII